MIYQYIVAVTLNSPTILYSINAKNNHIWRIIHFKFYWLWFKINNTMWQRTVKITRKLFNWSRSFGIPWLPHFII